ncbi:MAG: TIGR03032 family protein [Anaerolineae bacterium]
MPETASGPAPFEFLELSLFQVTTSPHFMEWLSDAQVSLAFTNTDQLFMIGLKADGRLSVATAPFERCMGLARASASTLYVASDYQLWRLENALPPGQTTESGCDAFYIPQTAYTTGVLGIHDLAVDPAGRVVFVNTLLGCLSTLSERYNFTPLWHPPFLPDLVAVDRCHLNGLALRDGHPAYVTSVSQDRVDGGWRQHKRDGGTVTDVVANQVILTGLSMPHSPRWYRDQLWLTNAGTGQFGRVDLKQGRFEPLIFAPGFLRGVDFVGKFAIVGSSKSRTGELYVGLPLEETLKEKQLEPQHGLYVVDLESGEIAHWLRLEGGAREIYSLITLPGIIRPAAIEPDGEPLQELVTMGRFQPYAISH